MKYLFTFIAFFGLLVLFNWYQPPIEAASAKTDPSTVLVIANQNNVQSQQLADFYIKQRLIPSENKLLVSWSPEDIANQTSWDTYKTTIAQPVYSKIATLPRIDYIVLIRNLPTTFTDLSFSVDDVLASKNLEKPAEIGGSYNSYYGSTERFSSNKFNRYIVTRLDGQSWEDCYELVRNSVRTGNSQQTQFYFDRSPLMGGGYAWWDKELGEAAALLKAKGAGVNLESSDVFGLPDKPVDGYMSWGSNDPHFNLDSYNQISFRPGAIADTAVSTSASNLRSSGGEWQSQIATLIHNGVTGVKGYTAEPYLGSISRPAILFPRYYAGYNLGESFTAASTQAVWRQVIVGDPLSQPYLNNFIFSTPTPSPTATLSPTPKIIPVFSERITKEIVKNDKVADETVVKYSYSSPTPTPSPSANKLISTTQPSTFNTPSPTPLTVNSYNNSTVIPATPPQIAIASIQSVPTLIERASVPALSITNDVNAQNKSYALFYSLIVISIFLLSLAIVFHYLKRVNRR